MFITIDYIISPTIINLSSSLDRIVPPSLVRQRGGSSSSLPSAKVTEHVKVTGSPPLDGVWCSPCAMESRSTDEEEAAAVAAAVWRGEGGR